MGIEEDPYAISLWWALENATQGSTEWRKLDERLFETIYKKELLPLFTKGQRHTWPLRLCSLSPRNHQHMGSRLVCLFRYYHCQKSIQSVQHVLFRLEGLGVRMVCLTEILTYEEDILDPKVVDAWGCSNHHSLGLHVQGRQLIGRESSREEALPSKVN